MDHYAPSPITIVLFGPFFVVVIAFFLDRTRQIREDCQHGHAPNTGQTLRNKEDGQHGHVGKHFFAIVFETHAWHDAFGILCCQ